MHLIIDGYNLIHASRSLTRLSPNQLQQERDRLLDQLTAYRQIRACEITLVFDGWQGGWNTEKRERRKGIELIFSRLGEKADEVIKRLIKEKGAGVMVITSDRDISRYAERMSVTAVSSEQFQQKMEEAFPRGQEKRETEKEEKPSKGKGPSKRPSKREKRVRAALRKL